MWLCGVGVAGCGKARALAGHTAAAVAGDFDRQAHELHEKMVVEFEKTRHIEARNLVAFSVAACSMKTSGNSV